MPSFFTSAMMPIVSRVMVAMTISSAPAACMRATCEEKSMSPAL
jgi:hypothetical protein